MNQAIYTVLTMTVVKRVLCVSLFLILVFSPGCSNKDSGSNVIESTLVDRTTNISSIYYPIDIELHNNKYWILDKSSSSIRILSLDYNFLDSLGTIGQGPGELLRPCEIAFYSDGSYVVADAGSNRYSIFDDNDNYIRQWRVARAHEEQTVLGTYRDSLLVSSYVDRDSLLVVFDKYGNIVNKFGIRPFHDRPQFNFLERVKFEVNNEGIIFVAFGAIPEIRIYTIDGTLLALQPMTSEHIVAKVTKFGDPRNRSDMSLMTEPYSNIITASTQKNEKVILTGPRSDLLPEGYILLYEYNYNGTLLNTREILLPNIITYRWLNGIAVNPDNNHYCGIVERDSALIDIPIIRNDN